VSLLVGAYSGRKTSIYFAEYALVLVCWDEDAGFRPLAQWIIWRVNALTAHARPNVEQERSMPELAISVEKVAFLIEKTREYDVKEGASDPDSGSNGADDNMIDVLEDDGGDPVAREITGFINAMTEDEQIDLVALMRLGRGDGTIEEWDELRREAADGRDRNTASYLLGEPLVSDYLAEGLDAFGLTWTDERTTPVR
jgi:hypothetical protein